MTNPGARLTHATTQADRRLSITFRGPDGELALEVNVKNHTFDPMMMEQLKHSLVHAVMKWNRLWGWEGR
jgi:hypothetical protein